MKYYPEIIDGRPHLVIPLTARQAQILVEEKKLFEWLAKATLTVRAA